MKIKETEDSVHYLKTWPEYYENINDQTKKFELRKNEDFQIGDVLVLQEYKPNDGYTGRETMVRVTYILEGGIFGLHRDYCIMSIEYV